MPLPSLAVTPFSLFGLKALRIEVSLVPATVQEWVNYGKKSVTYGSCTCISLSGFHLLHPHGRLCRNGRLCTALSLNARLLERGEWWCGMKRKSPFYFIGWLGEEKARGVSIYFGRAWVDGDISLFSSQLKSKLSTGTHQREFVWLINKWCWL